ncbi:hypothetical protein ACIP68_23195 [Streptomyces griseoviridis]
MQPEDITNRFTYPPPASPAVQKALAITKLEESVMWDTTAIARSGSET